MRRIVNLYLKKDDNGCREIQEFLQEQDLIINVRDIETNPLTYDELSGLIRHLNLGHFINTASPLYSSKRLDVKLPERREVIKMLAENNDLLRKPIIVAGRLMVIGCNLPKIIEMLQIKGGNNGDDPKEDESSRYIRKPVEVRPEKKAEVVE